MPRDLVPFRQFVLKVASRCDLACDHCYVYSHGDESWRGQPRVMADAAMEQVAARIAEHARAHALPETQVIFHGGEPLLAGPARLARLATVLRDAVEAHTRLELRIHTNGLTLNPRFLAVFAEHGIQVGLSIDGDKAANDRHRTYADGRTSYPGVVRAAQLLGSEEHRSLYAGLLCTIDLANEPVAVYRALVALQPPAIEFLLPHATWDRPPFRPHGGATAYAAWLIAIFEEWVRGGKPVPVRLFDSIINTTLGWESVTEAMGLGPVDLVVVETDGSIEQVDSLKAAYPGAPATGLDVFSHSFDDAAKHPGVVARQGGLDGLCETCRACPVVESCGGGLYTHRFKTGSGFQNPSVYCEDLKSLIRHVEMAAEHRLPARDVVAFATGSGGADAVSELLEEQLNLKRMLLAAVRDRSGDDCVDEAWDLLSVLEQKEPAAAAAVFAHPFVRAWAVRSLDGSSGADPTHLASVAIAAAVRAGADAELRVPIRDGVVAVPTLGRFLVGTGGQAVARVVSGALRLECGGRKWTTDDPAWQPVRRLTAGDVTVALEDTDPYRDCFDGLCLPRLDDAAAALWQERFTDAWRVLGSGGSMVVQGLAAGLVAITPLETGGTGGPTRHAFGAIGLALPPDGVTFALRLLSEFQRQKMAAVLDIFDLFEPDSAPQALSAQLEDAYVQLATAEFWGSGENCTRATRRAAEAVDVLAGSGTLTPVGTRFVGAISDALKVH